MAELGHEVVGVDVDVERVARLSRGEAPFYEPGFAELFGAMMIGLGIAGGVTLGEFLGAPLRLGTKGGGRSRSTAMRGVTQKNLRQLRRRRAVPTTERASHRPSS